MLPLLLMIVKINYLQRPQLATQLCGCRTEDAYGGCAKGSDGQRGERLLPRLHERIDHSTRLHT